MTCAACGNDAPDMAHEFYEGSPDRPVRKWTVVAPLYHRVDKPGPHGKVTHGFCDAYCVAIWLKK